MSDDYSQIKKKINKYCFSCSKGDGTLDEHKIYGGDIKKDIACVYLLYFEYEDEKLDEIYSKFTKGKMSCSDVKSYLIDLLTNVNKKHNEIRNTINQSTIKKFMI